MEARGSVRESVSVVCLSKKNVSSKMKFGIA